ncbi:MAG: DUF192 domain-containing protein [Terricaulis sp.]
MIVARFAAVLLALALAACAPDGGANEGQGRRTEELIIETDAGPVRLNVEIADDDAERAQGLMFRQRLADDAGMLFEFEEPENASFWMRNTPLSLDIIFIGVDGRILNIADHTTPYSESTILAAGLTKGVLEIAAGRAEAMGVRPGQLVRHPFFQTD